MKNSSQKKFNSDLKLVYSDNNSISVIFQDNNLLMGVVGEFNSNLKELERLTNSNNDRIRAQANRALSNLGFGKK